MDQDLRALIPAERRSLADDLASLDDSAWRAPSLCQGWTVEDVVAHLTQRNVSTPRTLAMGVLRHRGLQRFIDAGLTAHRGATPAETLERFTSTAERPTPGPGTLQTYLGELLIHAEDIRRPLGITHLYPRDQVTALLSSRARLARGLTRGLSLVVTDSGTVIGRGPSVRGPAMSLLMAVSGRAAHLEDLTGPGAPALAMRVRG